MLKNSSLGSRGCIILEIDMALLRDAYVFRAQEIVDEFDLLIPEEAKASTAKEYLVAHQIHAIAITKRQTVSQIKSGRCLLASNCEVCEPMTILILV